MGRDRVRPPLSAQAFHVLLALEQAPLHGYAIMMQIRHNSDTFVGPGAVYGALQRLGDRGLVREGALRPPERGSRLRQEYEITEEGRQALQAEARRMARLVRLAAERRLLAKHEAP